MKRFLICLLAFTFCTGFFGCDSGGEKVGNKVLLSSFSGLEELRSFKCYNYLNKVEINKDKEFITDGETSAKFTVDGEKGGIPEVCVFTGTKWLPKKDFSDVQALSVDVFNASESDRRMQFSFMTRYSGTTRSEYTGNEFTLVPGPNQVILTIDREAASQACFIDKVEYIKFTFENGHENPYVIYMDNLLAHLTKEPLPQVSKEYKDSELLFFDDKVDRYYVTPTLEMALATHAPKISINRNKKFIKSGTGSLKITPAVDMSQGANNYSPGIQITGEPLTRLDFSEYSAIEVSICCDFPLIRQNIGLRLTDATGGFDREVYPNIREAYFGNNWEAPFEVGKWYVLTVDLNDLEEKGIDLTKVGSLKFFFGNNFTGDLVGSEPYSYYFDEFKLLK